MQNFFSDIRNNHEKLQRVVLFIVTGIIIVMLLPKEGKFKYEYQKGRPWSHEDLVAPFNFAIEKPKAELDGEIKEISDNAKVYLKLDESAKEKAYNGFRSKFLASFKPDSSNARSLKKLDKNLFAGQSILNSIYTRGILRKTEELENLQDGQLIYLLKGNRCMPFPWPIHPV